MSDINQLIELTKAVEETIELSTKTQDEVKSIKGRQDAFDKEKIDKMATDAAGALEKCQQISMKQSAQEKIINEIATSAYRPTATGTLCMSTEEKEYKRHILNYLRFNTKIPCEMVDKKINQYVESVTFGDKKMALKFAAELVSGIDPAGGYFVLPERIAKMITRFFESSPMRQLASVENTSSNRIEIIIDDNEADSGGFVGEVDDRSATTASPNIGLETIDVNEQFAQPIASVNQLMDAAFDVEEWLMRKVSNKLSRVENTAFVVGGGAKSPRGFMNAGIYPEWAINTSSDGKIEGVYERGKLETIETFAPDIVGLDDLTTVHGTLLAPYRANAKWVMHRLTWTQILKLKTTFGTPLISITYLANGAPSMALLGDPVVLAADVAKIADNAFTVAYGDFKEGYTIVDRAGIFVLRDQITTKGKVKFYTTKRVGGAVTSFDSIKRLKMKAGA